LKSRRMGREIGMGLRSFRLIVCVAALLALTPGAWAEESSAVKTKPAEVKVGQPMPDFALPDQDGKEWKLSVQKGKKAVIISIGYTACLCGRDALKDLQTVQDKYGPRGLQVVHVNMEAWRLALDPSFLVKFAKENGITYPLLAEKEPEVSSRFPRGRMPILCLVDKEGIVRFTLLGRPADYLKQVTEQVEKCLPAPPPNSPDCGGQNTTPSDDKEGAK